MHHLLVPSAVAYELHVLASLFLGPLLFPYGVALAVNGINGRDMNALCGAYIRQDRSLRDEVAHHEETATSYIQRTEKCLLHPICKLMDTPLVTAEFVVVEVVDDDIVRTRLTLTETTRRLPTATGQEIHPVLGGELTLRPVAERHLLPEVGNDALVILEFCLYVT